MKKGFLVILFLFIILPKGFAQVDSLTHKNNIKLNLPLTLSMKGIFSDWILAGVQYERLLTAKNSLSLGAIFFTSNRVKYYVGLEQMDQVVIFPQWRHYFRKNKENYFNGFFLGASTIYLYETTSREIDSESEKRNYFGAGVLIGYQQVIKKRFSVDVSPALHLGRDDVKTESIYFQKRLNTTLFVWSLEAHIGYIF